MRVHSRGLSIAALALAMSAPAFAEEAKMEAVIVSHTGGHLTARTREGDLTVVLSASTKIREKSGLSKKARDAKSLIPGLIIEVEGDHQGGTIHASEIDFKQKDWRAAIASKAGTHEEFARNAAALEAHDQELKTLRTAMIEGHEYVIRKETTVLFASGKTAIAPQYQANLKAIGQEAASFGNYRVSILGFADPRGDAAANERLSLKRAAAVSNFLRQSGHIEPGRVLSPSAMGEGTNAPGETAPASDAEARRVVVRIITPKTQLTK